MTDIPQELFEKPEVPRNLRRKSGSIFIENALISAGTLATVPNLSTGGNRHRKWGFLLCARVVPNLDQIPEGPLIFPPTSMQFIDADDLEDLRERVNHEIDAAIETAKKLKEYDDKQAHQSQVRDIARKIAQEGMVIDSDSASNKTTE